MLAVLDALRVELGEERYRAAPMLRRLATEEERRLRRESRRESPPRTVCSPVTKPPFQRFLDAHREDVWRFLVAAVGREAADDCFQETFIAAMRAYPRTRDREPARVGR